MCLFYHLVRASLIVAMVDAWMEQSPAPLALFEASAIEAYVDGRARGRFWEEARFPLCFFEDFMALLFLALQTSGSPQRAESLELMTPRQARELLDWGVAELDVAKLRCSFTASTFIVDEDAWMLLCFYNRSPGCWLLLRLLILLIFFYC